MTGSDARRERGRRHDVRQPTFDELRELRVRVDALQDAYAAVNDHIVALYDAGVSQATLGRALGVTQGAIHLRVLRHTRWRAAGSPRLTLRAMGVLTTRSRDVDEGSL